ncbi:ribbon-helix-helix domain-containing protein [Kitasatospora sp. NPDC003701]
MSTVETSSGGRPSVGDRVPLRLPDSLKTTVDRIAGRRGGRERAAVLRELVERGINCPDPNSGHTLMTDHPTADLLEQILNDDEDCGIDVYGDGTNYWVIGHDGGDVLTHTTHARYAAIVQGFALVAFENTYRSDLLSGIDPDEDGPAFPELVRAGRDILDDLAAQERQLTSRNIPRPQHG